MEAETRHAAAVTLIEPTPALVELVVEMLRPADLAELHAFTSAPPLEAIEGFIVGSQHVHIALHGHLPLGVVGVEDHGRLGVPWFLGTTAIDRVPLAFLCASREVVRGWRRQWDLLENLVYEQHTTAKRWLRWLGFHLAPEPQPYGFRGELFRRFWWERTL